MQWEKNCMQKHTHVFKYAGKWEKNVYFPWLPFQKYKFIIFISRGLAISIYLLSERYDIDMNNNTILFTMNNVSAQLKYVISKIVV